VSVAIFRVLDVVINALMTLRFFCVLPISVAMVACGGSSTLKGEPNDGGGDSGADASLPPPEDDASVASEAGVADAGGSDASADEDAAPIDPACATIPVDATRTVHIRFSADDECTVFINGTEVGMSVSWPSPVTLDVSVNLYPGKRNVIAIMARNLYVQNGLDRGFIGQIDDLSDGGTTPVVFTDDTWLTSTTEQSGWPAELFDDSTWVPAAVVANHGDAPWGALLGTSDAKWLWSAPIPVAVADKPMEETAFFRKTFFFGTDGATLSGTPGCPPISPGD
jgi:hypothetical protein